MPAVNVFTIFQYWNERILLKESRGMNRTLATAYSIWKRRGFLWPFTLLARAFRCRMQNLPRGLIVEPAEACTGNCAGCLPLKHPALLQPEHLNSWLEASPAKPVTIHFSGKHSDPLASRLLGDLAITARSHCSMLSLSTIGLGLKPGHETLPFDRWIFSLPAATEQSWNAVRGNGRFSEALNNIEIVRQTSEAMVEVVLTVWKPSGRDGEAFRQLAEKHGWAHTKVVFGRFDPTGYHVGRLENLAVDSPDSPYMINSNGAPELKRKPDGCPLAGCLFLDATGTLHPCPFTGSESPSVSDPSAESWETAKIWAEHKRDRAYAACEWCI
jgi:MoaA/NifB/PqqE/SkfB family radical SAM enzyme